MTDPVHVAAGAVRGAETLALRAVRPDRGPTRRAARALSAISRQGRVWAGLSAAMAAHPRLRAAGRDGLFGWGAASGASFAIKAVSGRRRPRLVRAIGASASSSSMPSSHTAGAVAYAVAAGLREPWTATVALPLALGVAWSRAATGRHFPTDVAVGAGVGLLAVAAVHRIANRITPEPSPPTGSAAAR